MIAFSFFSRVENQKLRPTALAETMIYVISLIANAPTYTPIILNALRNACNIIDSRPKHNVFTCPFISLDLIRKKCPFPLLRK